MLLVTYDGVKWYPCLYDMDTSWGTNWSGDSIYDYENERVSLWINCLFYRMEDCFGEELTERYFNLREDILTKEHVMAMFNDFRAMIPEDTFEKEQIRWGNELPGYDYSEIEAYLDTVIPILDEKYADWPSWLMEREQLADAFFQTLEQDLSSE